MKKLFLTIGLVLSLGVSAVSAKEVVLGETSNSIVLLDTDKKELIRIQKIKTSVKLIISRKIIANLSDKGVKILLTKKTSAKKDALI